VDHQTRDLERCAQAGDVSAEVLLLRRRLRAGDLSPEGLSLAAFLGHSASRELLGPEAPEVPAGYQDWLERLRVRGPEVVMRASVAAAGRVVPLLAPLLLTGDAEHPHPVLGAAEDALVCPCLPHVRDVLYAAQRCEDARRRPDAVQLDRQREAAVSSCTSLALLFSDPDGAWEVMHHARLGAFAAAQPDPGADHETLPGEAGRLIKDAVRAELVPWVLGYGDPVRLRVAKRGEVEITSRSGESK
jgi:hypothetical protein